MMDLRALPRVFAPVESFDEPFALPQEEIDKLRKVLRLGTGDHVAVLPNDGTVVRCRIEGLSVVAEEVFRPVTEAALHLTVAQSLPKGDKLDEIVRACTEIGVAKFVLFPSDRTVVKWDEKKFADKVKRLTAIAREAGEVSFRTRIPEFVISSDLAGVLKLEPHAVVLSEVQDLTMGLRKAGTQMTIVVGPEGGWSPRELKLIGDRGVTLGPRVLRVDHAAAAASAMLLLS